MAEEHKKARPNIYSKASNASRGLVSQDSTQAPLKAQSLGVKHIEPTDKKVASTRIDAMLLDQVREFCYRERVTFSSFVEVGLQLALKASEDIPKDIAGKTPMDDQPNII